MIITQLCARTNLLAPVLQSILVDILTYLPEGGEHTAVLCLVQMFQTQSALESVPIELVHGLLERPRATEALANLSAQYDTSRMVSALFTALLTCERKDRFSLITTLIRSVRMSEVCARGVINTVVADFVSKAGVLDSSKSDLAKGYRQMILMLQARYSELVDDAIAVVTQRGSERSNQQALFKLLSLTFKGTKYEPIGDVNTTLFLGLQHPEPAARLVATRQLLAQIKDNSDASLLAFYRESLLARLADDDESVALAVLEFQQLADVVGADLLGSHLLEILRSEPSSLRPEPRTMQRLRLLLTMITSPAISEATAKFIFQSLLPIASQWDNAADILAMLQSRFASHWLLGGLSRVPASEPAKVPTDMAWTIVSALAHMVSRWALEDPHLKEFVEWSNLDGAHCTPATVLGLLVLAEAGSESASDVTSTERLRLCAAWADRNLGPALTNMGRAAEANRSNGEATLLKQLVYPPSHSHLVELSLHVLRTLIVKLVPQPMQWTVCGCASTDTLYPYWKSVTILFETLSKCPSRKPVDALLQELLRLHVGAQGILGFLAYFWTSDPVESPTLFQVHCIQIATAYVDAQNQLAHFCDYQVLVPSLLVAVSHASKAVRGASLYCLDVVRRAAEAARAHGTINVHGQDVFYEQPAKIARTSDVLLLIDALVQAKEEILADPNSVVHIIGRALSTASTQALKGSTSTLKQKTQEELLKLLVEAAASLSRTYPQSRLFTILSFCHNPAMVSLLTQFVAGLELYKACDQRSLIGEDESIVHLWKSLLDLIEANIAQPSPNTELATAFLRALKSSGSASELVTAVQRVTVEHISDKVFASFGKSQATDLFVVLLDLLQTADATVASSIRSQLRRLKEGLQSKLFIHQFSIYEQAVSSEESADSRKRGRVALELSPDSKPLSRLCSCLELAQSLDNIKNRDKMIPALFALLGVFLNTTKASEPTDDVEYCKQLVLVLVADCIKSSRSNGSTVVASNAQADQVVQCIRSLLLPVSCIEVWY